MGRHPIHPSNKPEGKCMVCGNPTDGDIYCSRNCVLVRQVRVFGAPIALLALADRRKQEATAADANRKRALELEAWGE